MRLLLLLFALFIVCLIGCAFDGPYRWVDDLSANALKPSPYRVQVGDRLVVNVWNQPPLSGEVLVRPDGNITLPLVGDVYVLHLTPAAAAAEIKQRLDGLVVEPHVAVSLTSNREATVSVVGEVRQSGSYPLRPGEGVLELLARAGGLSEFADKGRIFVVRRAAAVAAVGNGRTKGPANAGAPAEPMRVRMSYDKLARADGAAVQFVLQDGDVIVVD